MKKRILSVVFAAFMLSACAFDPQGGEPAVRTTVTEEEWNAALRLDSVRNVTVDGEFVLGQYYANVFEMNDSGLWEEYQRDFFWSSEKSPFLFITALLSFFCFPYGQFTYNDDLQQYEANNIVLTSFPIDSLQAPSMEISFDSIVFQFQNDRLVKYEGVLSQEQWLEMSAKSFSLSFTDYGTTSVTLPEVSAE